MQSEKRWRIAFPFYFTVLMTCYQLSEPQGFCTVPTRLPTSSVEFKGKESCTSSCEVWTSLETCQVDPTCFFKTTLTLVEPATYGHFLDLANIRSPSDIEKRMKLIPALARNAMDEINDMFERISSIHLDFEEKAGVREPGPPGPLYQQPHQGLNFSSISNLTCDNYCEFSNKNTCKLGVFCFFNEEIKELQRENIPLSYLLDLSGLDSEVHKFDDESVLQELFRKLRVEKIQLRAFLAYAFNTYNIMVDINSRNIDYITKYLQNSEFTEAKDLDQQCSTVYRSLMHRPAKLECADQILKFLDLGFSIAVGFAGGIGPSAFPPDSGTGVVSPRANCPGICVKVAANRDCIKDIPCMKTRFNF